MTNKFQG